MMSPRPNADSVWVVENTDEVRPHQITLEVRKSIPKDACNFEAFHEQLNDIGANESMNINNLRAEV